MVYTFIAATVFDAGCSAFVASTEGNTLCTDSGVVTYQLPAPPGHWVTAAECHVYRDSCPKDVRGLPLDIRCTLTARQCRQEVNESAVVDNFRCQPIRIYQPCDWRRSPELVGKMVEVLSAVPLDADYPFACAAGVLGSSDPSEQGSSYCGGPCPAGSLCPSTATTRATAQPCPLYSYCPRGSTVPTRCPPGTVGDAHNLQSESECTACYDGHWCSGGIAFPCEEGSPGGDARTARAAADTTLVH